jgi:hypothetical protein
VCDRSRELLRYLSMQRFQANGGNTPSSAKIALEQPQTVLLLSNMQAQELRQPIMAGF